LRYVKLIGFIFIFISTGSLVSPVVPADTPQAQTLRFVKKESLKFAYSVELLSEQIGKLDSARPQTIVNAKRALTNCRLRYKKISFFLDYFYPSAGKLYNGAAKKELEEPYLEMEDPQGLQPIEVDLYDLHPVRKKTEMENLVLVMKESARDLPAVYETQTVSEAQILESLHLELIRVMSLYITGYDAPFLKTGIREVRSVLESMDSVIKIFSAFSKWKDGELETTLRNAERYLKGKNDFIPFNRLIFLTDYALPLEEQLSACIRKNGLEIRTVQNLSYNGNLFRNELISCRTPPTKEMQSLGKTLFFEKALSGNNSRSCASCHEPSKYFTDQLMRNQSLHDHTNLKRNTPSLFYTAYQSAQFWDGRDSTLNDQIHDVLMDPNEMGGSAQEIIQKLSANARYRLSFQKAFQTSEENNAITITNIQAAISVFVGSLAPMNSRFDQYMAGNHAAMTTQQQKGFNLFMGKAACGTCHFAPVFNGSTPPFFNKTEYEVLGVPQSGDFSKKILDKDPGRYTLYPVDMYRGAFKTPTLRNVAHTFPYMHNGSMKTLHKVLYFYNHGGGFSLGMQVPNQTLPGNKLNLTANEINSIIAFLNALTDH
jgi:cytochrome c peroxidase